MREGEGQGGKDRGEGGREGGREGEEGREGGRKGGWVEKRGRGNWVVNELKRDE